MTYAKTSTRLSILFRRGVSLTSPGDAGGGATCTRADRIRIPFAIPDRDGIGGRGTVLVVYLWSAEPWDC